MNNQINKYKIDRYDLSKDRSLQAWSAGDEYLLASFKELEQKPNHLCIYNDRFGFLTCHLHSFAPTVILTHKSQEKAINANLKVHNINNPKFANPLSTLEIKMDFALVKVPKSLGRFQLFLEQIIQNSTDDITVFCAFMTRHFSPKLLKIAQEYFEVVEQSRAVKKARLLVLTKKKKVKKGEIVASLFYNSDEYKQYFGVFSSEHIDYATQFFLEHLEVKDSDHCILDLGSGNGIIGKEIFKQLPDAEIHLMDDSFLAVSSAELNIQEKNIHHHYNNDLSIFANETFDLIVTNPPFHFEYEINIQIPISLFRECFRCLKKDGILQLVSSKHLNYKVHLEPLFSAVQIIAENEKFVVYKCIK
jgi:16S rRNA G1207 methylase RsmC